MAWKIDFDYVSAQPNFVIDKEADGTTPWGFGWVWGGGRSLIGRPVPKSATQTDSNKLADVFPLPALACVGERFRAIVESFEPGIHEFHPIQLKSRKGVPYGEPYFLINVRQRFDSILVKGNNVDWSKRTGGDMDGMPFASRPRAPRFVSRPTIAGRHLWQNFWVYGGGIMVSEELRAALMQAKIRRLKFAEPRADYFEEVDKPFDYREQVPEMIEWMDANRPESMFEWQLDWVKTFMPHWLS